MRSRKSTKRWLAATAAVLASLSLTSGIATAAPSSGPSPSTPPGSPTVAGVAKSQGKAAPPKTSSCGDARKHALTTKNHTYMCVAPSTDPDAKLADGILAPHASVRLGNHPAAANPWPYTDGLTPVTVPLNPPNACGTSLGNMGGEVSQDRFQSCNVDDVTVTLYVANDAGGQTAIGQGQVRILEWDQMSNTSRIWDDYVEVYMYQASGAIVAGTAIQGDNMCYAQPQQGGTVADCGSRLASPPTLLQLNSPLYTRVWYDNNSTDEDYNGSTINLTITNAAAPNPATVTPTGIGDIRCDNAPEWSTVPGMKTGGCVNPVWQPIYVLSLSDPTVKYTAAHLQAAQADPNVGLVGFFTSSAYPLERLTDQKRQNANRNKACGSFVPNPPDPVTGQDSCDEYPFASTYEGAASGIAFSTAHVPLTDNVAAGNLLGSLYKTQRMNNLDSFWVETTP